MKNIFWAAVYFALATIITSYFIKQGAALYSSHNKMILSANIAGAKWAIQIIAAVLFLNEKKWLFIKLIAFNCFIGSCFLLPYTLFSTIRIVDYSFFASLIISVLFMIIIYYKVVQQIAISKWWFWSWFCCLCIAIYLQATIVFVIF